MLELLFVHHAKIRPWIASLRSEYEDTCCMERSWFRHPKSHLMSYFLYINVGYDAFNQAVMSNQAFKWRTKKNKKWDR